MKKRTGLLLGVGGTLTALVLAVVVVPAVFQDALTERAVRIVSDTVGAEVDVERADVGLLRSFPRVSVALTELTVDGSAPYAGDPLLTARSVDVRFDLLDVVRGNYTARGVVIDAPVLRAISGPNGTSNFDFGGDSDEASSAEGPQIRIDHFEVHGMDLSWTDEEGGLTVGVTELDLVGRGDIAPEAIVFQTTTQVAELSVLSEGEVLAHELTLEATGDLTYGLDDGRIELANAVGTLNALPLSLDAVVVPSADAMTVTADLSAPEATVAGLISLVPPSYRGSLDQMEAMGDVALTARVDGSLDAEANDYPQLSASVTLTDGSYHTQGLPGRAENLALDVVLDHPQGPLEKASVEVKAARFAISSSRFSASGRVGDALGDPLIDLDVDADLDLAHVADTFPIEGFAGSGTVVLDVGVKGRLSALQAPEANAIEVDGSLAATGLRVESESLGLPMTIARARVRFSPDHAEVSELQTTFGESDLRATGEFHNLLGYALGGDVLSGRLDATSKRLDLAPFMAGDEPEGGDSEASGVFQVPADLDLVMNLTAERVDMPPMRFDAVRGRVHLDGGVLDIRQLDLRTLGGNVGLSGTYAAPTASAAELDMRIDLEGVQAASTLEQFTSLQRLVPSSWAPEGRFGAQLDIDAALDETLSLVPASLQSKGAVRAAGLSVRPGVLAEAAQKLGRRDLERVGLTRSALSYTVDDGQMRIARTPIALGDLSATLGGGVGMVDQVLDLSIETRLPTAGLPDGLLGSATGGLPKKIPVGLGVGGTVSRPTLRVDTSGVRDLVRDRVEQEVDAVKEQVVDAAAEQADRALERAQQEADRIMAAARKESRKITQRANREADRLVDQAGNNPIAKAAAKEAAKVAKRQAAKAADRVVDVAQKKADALLRDARRQTR